MSKLKKLKELSQIQNNLNQDLIPSKLK